MVDDFIMHDGSFEKGKGGNGQVGGTPLKSPRWLANTSDAVEDVNRFATSVVHPTLYSR